MYWLKDGQPLRTGARIRAVSRERISVMSVAREDRGMYQCFVRNEYEMAQGIAELRLGGESLFAYRFYRHVARAEKMERRKEIVWPSERIVSRKDFVRNGRYTYIFEITRLILARHRLFLYGEKLGLSFPTFQ